MSCLILLPQLFFLLYQLMLPQLSVYALNLLQPFSTFDHFLFELLRDFAISFLQAIAHAEVKQAPPHTDSSSQRWRFKTALSWACRLWLVPLLQL